MKLMLQKLEGWGYCMVTTARFWLQPFSTDPPVWRTDRRTDGRWHIRAIAHMLSRVKSIQMCKTEFQQQQRQIHLLD